MANRTQRTTHAEVLLAQRHRAEHDAFTRRLSEVEGELQRLNTALGERNTELTRAQSDFMRGIIREEVQRLEGQIAERGAERQDILQQIATLRQELTDLTGRVGTLESRQITLRGDVDGLQANSEAHATAISRLEAANGWIPIACAAVTAVIVYFFIEWPVDWWMRDRPVATHIQFAWAIGLAAIVGIIATFVLRDDRVATRVSSSASSGVVVAPQPPADQPAPAAGVTPPPPPPSGTQFSTVQAAAAASASVSN